MMMRRLTAAFVMVAFSAGVYAASGRLSTDVCAVSTLVHLYHAMIHAKNGELDNAAMYLRLAVSFAPRHDHDEVEEKGWACARLELDSAPSTPDPTEPNLTTRGPHPTNSLPLE